MTAGKNGPGILPSQIEDKVAGFGTARVRAGYAFGMDMIYATGGYAWLNNKTNISVPGTVNQVDATHNGWAAGAGWEHAFNNHWSVKAEYLYLSFETKNYLYPSFLPALPFNTSLNIQTGKLGVNYRF
jgi:outer membrane immunogenic protein